ncbi:MAG TPA: tRNA epoxyqueuosine(34) reductase QueG [Gammaproteobacteria bacterium]|jgi:epoxyqueuosine reductase|nr:tRNA epoxyqueuosine(34) reductase QueG [Gammaproteobacteria bacterium]
MHYIDMSGTPDFTALTAQIKDWGRELGFQQLGISGVELPEDERHLLAWLEAGRHGQMDYMQEHGTRRSRPRELVPGTLRVVSARMDYWPADAADAEDLLGKPDLAYVARYALGRDYHKVLRARLQRLADRIQSAIGPFGYRAFTDSAPVLEKALARGAGLGWIGKHTNLINKNGGSWFFLGELFTDLPLPMDEPATDHCGSCRVCMDVCPTGAIVAPYELDARRCIAYLTIENKGPIPEEFRTAMGNRVFGCDDCQLFCPWNKFAQATSENDFKPRHGLDDAKLTELFGWSEEEFLKRTEGSAIRRTGYVGWLRNIAVGLGNAPTSEEVVQALKSRESHPSELVREHVHWALAQHR